MDYFHVSLLLTTRVILHLENYTEGFIDIFIGSKSTCTSAFEVVVRLPSKLSSGTIQAHSCADTVEKVQTRNIGWEDDVAEDLVIEG